MFTQITELGDTSLSYIMQCVSSTELPSVPLCLAYGSKEEEEEVSFQTSCYLLSLAGLSTD